MITMDEARREYYYEKHPDELHLENTIEEVKCAIQHLHDDFDWIRRICNDADVFQMCETIDIAIGKDGIECSAWNDYKGSYLFDFTIADQRH